MAFFCYVIHTFSKRLGISIAACPLCLLLCLLLFNNDQHPNENSSAALCTVFHYSICHYRIAETRSCVLSTCITPILTQSAAQKLRKDFFWGAASASYQGKQRLPVEYPTHYPISRGKYSGLQRNQLALPLTLHRKQAAEDHPYGVPIL